MYGTEVTFCLRIHTRTLTPSTKSKAYLRSQWQSTLHAWLPGVAVVQACFPTGGAPAATSAAVCYKIIKPQKTVHVVCVTCMVSGSRFTAWHRAALRDSWTDVIITMLLTFHVINMKRRATSQQLSTWMRRQSSQRAVGLRVSWHSSAISTKRFKGTGVIITGLTDVIMMRRRARSQEQLSTWMSSQSRQRQRTVVSLSSRPARRSSATRTGEIISSDMPPATSPTSLPVSSSSVPASSASRASLMTSTSGRPVGPAQQRVSDWGYQPRHPEPESFEDMWSSHWRICRFVRCGVPSVDMPSQIRIHETAPCASQVCM